MTNNAICAGIFIGPVLNYGLLSQMFGPMFDTFCRVNSTGNLFVVYFNMISLSFLRIVVATTLLLGLILFATLPYGGV